MIQRDLILTVNNTTSTLNEPLVIYQHDRGLTLRIKVMKYKFMFNKIMEEDYVADNSIISARAIVLKPDGKGKFECPRQAIEDDCVIIPIGLSWTDEYLEIGKYQLQIQLYGSDYINERVTLPPFEFTVARPICLVAEEGVEIIGEADSAIADLSILTNELSGAEAEDGELANGIYDKTEWEPGDLITSDDLNKFEDAVEYLVRTQQARAIFTPSVSETGFISWTNDLALENPEPVSILGPQGPRGYKGDKGDKGEQGDQGPRGLKGDTGEKGADGTSIMTFEGEVETIAALDDIVSPVNGSAYICREDGNVYVFDGSYFINCGDIQGPKGDKGDKGDTGEQGPKGEQGIQGPKGADGTVVFDSLTDEQKASLKGDTGETGPKGDAFTYDDLTAEQKADLTQDFVTCSDNITRIEIVAMYPEIEEYGVLYIKVSDE